MKYCAQIQRIEILILFLTYLEARFLCWDADIFDLRLSSDRIKNVYQRIFRCYRSRLVYLDTSVSFSFAIGDDFFSFFFFNFTLICTLTRYPNATKLGSSALRKISSEILVIWKKKLLCIITVVFLPCSD